jgi:hypothetical protein
MPDPNIISFSIKVIKQADIDEVYRLCSQLSGFKISKTAKDVFVAIVEQEDIQKRPVRFIIIDFKQDEIIINFTVSDDESSSIRKLEVLSKTIPILEVALDAYKISVKPLLSLIDASLTEMLQKFTRDVKDVLIENDRLRDKIKEQQEKIKKLDEQVKVLTSNLYELNTQISDLRLKLQKYEKPSEEALENMIMEWLRERRGSIDIAEFSKINKVPMPRVEETLNALVQKGYIKPL